MLPRVIEVRHVAAYRVWIRFSDGREGEIDLEAELWGPVFEPLRDISEFAKLRVEPELDTVVWPNGADLSPDWLYSQLARGSKASFAAE